MLVFLVTTLSFLLFLKSLPLHFHKQFFPLSPIPKPIIKKDHIFGGVLGFISTPNLKMKQCFVTNPELHKPKELNHEKISISSLLDLPELALDCILEKLPPSGLSSMAGVCRSLRERCTSQHFWERHLRQKWGTVLSPAAYRDWELFVASRMKNYHGNSEGTKPQGFAKFFLLQMWPLTWFLSKFDKGNDKEKEERGCQVHDSVMSLYLALDSGKFWFPAQVYNRENGHIGFMLSCYDAKLSYDHHTDTFQARYPAHGRRAVAIESGVPWERLRASPVETSPHQLHISDCLNDLHPGDHIEIQWRRNKEFPYGWWYGVVGHLESCDGHENYCRCHASDAVVLEFNHYAPGSRWRRTVVSRKDHRETGSEADGFYGGIRKLYKTDEISTWKRLWPMDILQ